MASPYLFTPDEAQPAANYAAAYLRRRKFKVSIEVAVDDQAEYVTTLLARYEDLTLLIEAQRHPRLAGQFRDLVRRLAASRMNCQTYVVADSKGRLTAQLLSDLKDEGVGLFVADKTGDLRLVLEARNPALMVTPDPTLRYGAAANKQDVDMLVRTFNDGDRKAALDQMVDLVEQQTEEVIRKASRKGHMNVTEANIDTMDWSNQIDTLASAGRYSPGKAVLVTANQKADLHSFRGARNLLKHKVRSKKEGRKREQQFAERMMQGPRLFCELLAIKRTIK